MDGEKKYSESGFWDKWAEFAKTAGRELVEKVLQLVLCDPRSRRPAWAKGVAITALAYFVSPLDAIPDFVPFAGYADDLGVIAAALITLARF